MIQPQLSPRLFELPTPSSDKIGWFWTEESPQVSDTMPDGSAWPRITIITPSYNQGRYIEETIRSVLLQGYPNLEYIIIDGGSTDGTVEIIKKYAPWLTYWVSEPDSGQSHAINKGFEHATGQIMAWINSDDLYTMGSLSYVAQALSKSQKSMLVGSAIYLSAEGKINSKVDCRRPSYEEILYEGHSFPQPSVFWTSDLWRFAGPINEELYYIMDFDLWLRMCRVSNPIKFTEQALSYERIHPDQKTWIKNTDQHELSNKQKSQAVLNITGWYGMPIWLIRSYFRRVLAAIRARNLYLLRMSGYQKFVIQEIMAALLTKGRHMENI